MGRRDEGPPGTTKNAVHLRKITGPHGFLATLHGPTGPLTFEFGEARGNRFVTDQTGAFVQDVDYQPYGKPTSTGAEPGTTKYTSEQWNFGDALAAFGISQLGARLYDPAIGRFLSRDPLLIPRTAATTNAYAFAMNDPVNGSDPSGLCTLPGVQIDTGVPCPKEDKSPGSGGDLWIYTSSSPGPGHGPGRPKPGSGGGSSGPPVDEAQAKNIVRIVAVPTPVFAPDNGSDSHDWTDLVSSYLHLILPFPSLVYDVFAGKPKQVIIRDTFNLGPVPIASIAESVYQTGEDLTGVNGEGRRSLAVLNLLVLNAGLSRPCQCSRIEPGSTTDQTSSSAPVRPLTSDQLKSVTGGISKTESQIWQGLTNYRDGIKMSGAGRTLQYYTWDYTHGDIEVYDGTGKHLGSMDPVTGEMYKDRVKGRTLNNK